MFLAQLLKDKRQTFKLNESLDVSNENNPLRGPVKVLKSVIHGLPTTSKSTSASTENRDEYLENLIKKLPIEPRDRSLKEFEIRKMELRKEVIGGDFMNSQIDCYGKKITTLNIWQVREWQLLVFISSTFTDSTAERNILLEKILPYLRKKAYPHDIEVTFVDMR